MIWEIILTIIILLNNFLESTIVDNKNFTNYTAVDGSEFDQIATDHIGNYTPSEMVADKRSTINPFVKHLETESFMIGMFATFMTLILLGISACLVLCLFNTCKRMIKIVIV